MSKRPDPALLAAPDNDTFTWIQAQGIQPGLPSYRKVDYWAREGSLGRHRTPGTGDQRRWTRRELRILAAIQTLAGDLSGLCIEQVPALLVGRIWAALTTTELDWAVLNSGGVRIIAQLTAEDGSEPIAASGRNLT